MTIFPASEFLNLSFLIILTEDNFRDKKVAISEKKVFFKELCTSLTIKCLFFIITDWYFFINFLSDYIIILMKIKRPLLLLLGFINGFILSLAIFTDNVLKNVRNCCHNFCILFNSVHLH